MLCLFRSGQTTQPSQSVGKEASVTNAPDPFPDFVPYLLIGAGTASYYAAMTIRARDPDAIVLILGDEGENAYSRTHLSKGNTSGPPTNYYPSLLLELWWYGDKNFAETLQYKNVRGRTRDVYFEVDGFYIAPSNWRKFPHGCISILKNARVDKINASEKSVILESGKKIRFDKCLIATGTPHPLRFHLALGSRPKLLPELNRPDLAKRVHTLYTVSLFACFNNDCGFRSRIFGKSTPFWVNPRALQLSVVDFLLLNWLIRSSGGSITQTIWKSFKFLKKTTSLSKLSRLGSAKMRPSKFSSRESSS